jgi:hypothetical protein
LSSLTDFEEETEQESVGAGPESIDCIRFCYGKCSYESVSSEDDTLIDLTKGGDDGLAEKKVYNIEKTNSYIMATMNSEKQMRFAVYNAGGSGIQKVHSDFQLKYESAT